MTKLPKVGLLQQSIVQMITLVSGFLEGESLLSRIQKAPAVLHDVTRQC